jgi:hypothetical protein
MATFMALTAKGGKTVIVNADLIRAISTNPSGNSTIHFDDTHSLVVEEDQKAAWTKAYEAASKMP